MDDNTIWRMRIITCWITKATDAHSEYEILIGFHGNGNCAKDPQYYVYIYTACRVLCYFQKSRSSFKYKP